MGTVIPTSAVIEQTPHEDIYISGDEEDEDDDIEREKAHNLMYGGAGEYIYRRGKDPDNPDEGDPDPFAPIDDIKKRLDELYADLEELDTNHDILEVKFND